MRPQYAIFSWVKEIWQIKSNFYISNIIILTFHVQYNCHDLSFIDQNDLIFIYKSRHKTVVGKGLGHCQLYGVTADATKTMLL